MNDRTYRCNYERSCDVEGHLKPVAVHCLSCTRYIPHESHVGEFVKEQSASGSVTSKDPSDMWWYGMRPPFRVRALVTLKGRYLAGEELTVIKTSRGLTPTAMFMFSAMEGSYFAQNFTLAQVNHSPIRKPKMHHLNPPKPGTPQSTSPIAPPKPRPPLRPLPPAESFNSMVSPAFKTFFRIEEEGTKTLDVQEYEDVGEAMTAAENRSRHIGKPVFIMKAIAVAKVAVSIERLDK